MNLAAVERGWLCNPHHSTGSDRGRSITSQRVFCGQTARERVCEQPRPWENSGQLLQHRPAPAPVST